MWLTSADREVNVNKSSEKSLVPSVKILVRDFIINKVLVFEEKDSKSDERT